MGRKCCITKCKSNYGATIKNSNQHISTFKFPEDQYLKEMWLKAINRKDFVASKNSCVCINHFQPDDIEKFDKPAKLKPNVVPSIFEITGYEYLSIKRGRPKKSCSKIAKEKSLHNKEVSVSGFLDDVIVSYENLKKTFASSIVSDSWLHFIKKNVTHFLNVNDEKDDEPIKIENSLKIFENLHVQLFIKNNEQSVDDLKWLLGYETKVTKFSQIQTILNKYNYKTYNNKEKIENVKSQDCEEEMVIERLEEEESSDGEVFTTTEIEFISPENNFEKAGSNNYSSYDHQEDIRDENMQKTALFEIKQSKNKCFICKLEHEKPENLEEHLLSHLNMLPYKCDRCSSDQNLKTLVSLNNHFRMHLKPLKCKKCDMRFLTLTTRRTHELNIHANKGPQKCDVCQKVYQSLRGLRAHYKVHTNSEALKCQICSKILSSLYELKLHNRIHTREKPNKCPFCESSFNRISNLTEHKRRFHSMERPFECDFCKLKFQSKLQLKRHIEVHNPKLREKRLSSQIKGSPQKSVNESKEYECKICNKKFQAGNLFYSHMRQHQKKFQCSFCGIQIAQHRDFLDHENTHTGNRPYKCSICNMAFKTSSTYYGHRTVHTGEKNHSCKICGRKFSRYRHVIQHKRTHNGEKRYECNFCGKKYSDLSSFKRHQIVSHDNNQQIETQNEKQLEL